MSQQFTINGLQPDKTASLIDFRGQLSVITGGRHA